MFLGLFAPHQQSDLKSDGIEVLLKKPIDSPLFNIFVFFGVFTIYQIFCATFIFYLAWLLGCSFLWTLDKCFVGVADRYHTNQIKNILRKQKQLPVNPRNIKGLSKFFLKTKWDDNKHSSLVLMSRYDAVLTNKPLLLIGFALFAAIIMSIQKNFLINFGVDFILVLTFYSVIINTTVLSLAYQDQKLYKKYIPLYNMVPFDTLQTLTYERIKSLNSIIDHIKPTALAVNYHEKNKEIPIGFKNLCLSYRAFSLRDILLTVCEKSYSVYHLIAVIPKINQDISKEELWLAQTINKTLPAYIQELEILTSNIQGISTQELIDSYMDNIEILELLFIPISDIYENLTIIESRFSKIIEHETKQRNIAQLRAFKQSVYRLGNSETQINDPRLNVLRRRIYQDIIPQLQQLQLQVDTDLSLKIEQQIKDFESYFEQQQQLLTNGVKLPDAITLEPTEIKPMTIQDEATKTLQVYEHYLNNLKKDF